MKHFTGQILKLPGPRKWNERIRQQEAGDIGTLGGKKWIPEDAYNLQMKLLVVTHCEASGHRGLESTLATLSEGYTWTT